VEKDNSQKNNFQKNEKISCAHLPLCYYDYVSKTRFKQQQQQQQTQQTP